MYPSSFALAIENAELRASAETALAPLRSSIERYDRSNMEALLAGIAERIPEVLMLDIAAFQEQAGTALREIRTRAPKTKIVALHGTADPHWILESLRGGAAEFVQAPFSETLMPALARIVEARVENGSTRKKGRLLGFLSAKGGCGATTIACHVAVELQRQTKSNVLMADFDLASGLTRFLMKASGDYSVVDAARNLSRLDASLWQGFLSPVKPGLSVLPAPLTVSHRDTPEEADFQDLLRFMRTQHDWCVIDLGRSLTSVAEAALQEVDDLFLISTTEVIALHGLKSMARGLQDDQHNKHKLHVILNRAPKMMDITRDELEKILGRPLYATLPNDYPSLYESYAKGSLLPPGNRLAQHFARLTSQIIGVEAAKPKRRFSLLG
jgi:pilus assembly protein CpaE